jgi:hypothetical protein
MDTEFISQKFNHPVNITDSPCNDITTKLNSIEINNSNTSFITNGHNNNSNNNKATHNGHKNIVKNKDNYTKNDKDKHIQNKQDGHSSVDKNRVNKGISSSSSSSYTPTLSHENASNHTTSSLSFASSSSSSSSSVPRKPPSSLKSSVLKAPSVLKSSPSRQHSQEHSSIEPSKEHSSAYTILFKQGDDVRQDEISLQLIKYVDRILKENGLNLELITYEILALGPSEGIVEWVQGAEPLSDIIEKYSTKIPKKPNNTQRIHVNNPKNDKKNTIKNNKNNTNTNIDISNHIITPQTRDPNPIQEYLRYHNPSEYDEFGICENTMDIFIKSSAGYSVITYLLGVGDRHLDNLMLTPSGHFFHVDYGFLFGRDPKPFRPLVRFSVEMLSAMGGVEHEMYEEFLNLCSKAYNVLRRASESILSMIRLMIQAGIRDLSEKQSPLDALGGVLERFHLQLSDDGADLFIRGIMTDGAKAIFPRVMEHIHRIASTFR